MTADELTRQIADALTERFLVDDPPAVPGVTRVYLVGPTAGVVVHTRTQRVFAVGVTDITFALAIGHR